MRADLKIHLDGGGGIGPVRQTKGKHGGKPHEALVDNLVLELNERKCEGSTVSNIENPESLMS